MPSSASRIRPRRSRARRPRLTADALRIVNGLRRIVRAVELYSQDVFRKYGLTGPQLWAVKTLSRRGALATSELAEALAVQPSTLSVLVDRLERRGLVRRLRPREDRRFVEIALTARGRDLANRAPEPAQGRLLHGLSRLGTRQQRAIRDVIEQLVAMMEAADVEVRFFFSDD
ncbi:MAG TPA: MarR family transcriptional regulator [Gemmatimonadales bacterium]|nr:MarR family transcriptional regulator [Gemmatimonadales bacterium]